MVDSYRDTINPEQIIVGIMINSLRQIWYRLMAKQLRRPSGILANLTGNQMNISNDALYKLVKSQLALKEGDYLLEIGFGNGKFFPELYENAGRILISGEDLSNEMVTQAIKNNPSLYKCGRLRLQVGSSEGLPFEDACFDKIICINVIYFWEVPDVHLKEIYRVLKPGGMFYTGFRPAETMIKLPFTQYGFNLYTEEDWYRILSNNGFGAISSARTGSRPQVQSGLTLELDGISMQARR